MMRRKKLIMAAVAAAFGLAATAAQASLVLLGPEDFSGTGLGAVNTILTMQSPSDSSTETASVGVPAGGGADVITGDAKTGASQTQTRSISSLGITSANSLRVVFNANEPGGNAQSISLDNLVLNVFSPLGALLFTASYAGAPHLFADTFTGAGNSGFVFGLNAAEAGVLQAVLNVAGSGNDLVGISASASLATDGFETFFVANSVSAVPEPEQYGMLAAGLGLIGFMSRRRRTNERS